MTRMSKIPNEFSLERGGGRVIFFLRKKMQSGSIS